MEFDETYVHAVEKGKRNTSFRNKVKDHVEEALGKKPVITMKKRESKL